MDEISLTHVVFLTHRIKHGVRLACVYDVNWTKFNELFLTTDISNAHTSLLC